jgi:hypothetical protein
MEMQAIKDEKIELEKLFINFVKKQKQITDQIK